MSGVRAPDFRNGQLPLHASPVHPQLGSSQPASQLETPQLQLFPNSPLSNPAQQLRVPRSTQQGVGQRTVTGTCVQMTRGTLRHTV